MTTTNTDNTKTDASVLADTAEGVRVSLADMLDRADRAGVSVLVKAYGPTADRASVRLAIQTASVLAGGTKPRGNNGQKVNDVLALVGLADVADLTALMLAGAARVVLDGRATAAKAARKLIADERAASKAILNDRGAPKAARIAALENMTEIDATAANTKRAALIERVTSALVAARDAGVSAESIWTLVEDTFPALDQHAPHAA